MDERRRDAGTEAPDGDLAAFGMAQATEDEFCAALTRVERSEEPKLLALGLERLPGSARLWERAGHVLCEAEAWRPAAAAYERSILAELEADECVPGLMPARDIADTLRSLEPGRERASEAATGARRGPREAGGRHAPLVNLAILRRTLDGDVAVREIVMRYAPRMASETVALAMLEAGCGAEAVPMLLERKDARPITLARLYLAMGKSVEGIACMRVMDGRRDDVDTILDSTLGSCMTKYRRARVGPWAGMIPIPSVERIRWAAIEALAAQHEPSDVQRARAHASLQLLAADVGDAATTLAALRDLGPAVSPVVLEAVSTGPDRLRARVEPVLEDWAWDAAETRFMAETGVEKPPAHQASTDTRPSPMAIVHVMLRAAVGAARTMRVRAAAEETRGICAVCEWESLLAPGHPPHVLELAEFLRREGESGLARRLVIATARGGRFLGDAEVLRSILEGDAAMAFDFVLQHRPGSTLHFSSLGLSASQVQGLAIERLVQGRLPLEDVWVVLSELPDSAQPEVIRAALHRFPTSARLLAAAGYALIRAGRRRAARRVLARSLALRRAGASSDPDAEGWRSENADAVLARYPPNSMTSEVIRATVGPGLPLLVNLAVLTDEFAGREAALAGIRQHATAGADAVEVAAAFSAIGELDEARSHLEHAVLDRETYSSDALSGLIAAYAAEDRLEDAVAVARLKDAEWGLEMVSILLDDLVLSSGDDPPDAVIAYEEHFSLERALERTVAALRDEYTPQPAVSGLAEGLVEQLRAPDWATRERALRGLTELGPHGGGVLADFLTRHPPPHDGSAHARASALLEEWAWTAAEARYLAGVRPAVPG